MTVGGRMVWCQTLERFRQPLQPLLTSWLDGCEYAPSLDTIMNISLGLYSTTMNHLSVTSLKGGVWALRLFIHIYDDLQVIIFVCVLSSSAKGFDRLSEHAPQHTVNLLQ